MKRRKNKNRREITALLVIALFLLVAAIVITAEMYLQQKKQEMPVGTEEVAWEEEKTDETDETAESEASEPETQEPVYPKPDYDFTTEEITVTIEGVGREYTLAWVSDLHLISDHEAGEELGDVHTEYLDAIDKRYEELSVTDDGIHAEDLWGEIVDYLNYEAFDGVIFGGDIMDYCSNSNVAVIKEGLDRLRIPYIYIRADHDYGTYYGGVFFTEEEARALHKTIDGDEIGNKFWDRNDFMVLGIDNSTKDMPDYYLNMVADVYSRGRPVIMATHVPYESMVDASLAAFSTEVRGTVYYWSDASERYKPNDVTRQYLNMIYSEDTVVGQVLAGHVHASWDGMLTEQVSQHIFSPAFRGNIGIIHIVPGA